MSDSYRISVGLEEGPDGAVMVHALSGGVGCVALGASQDEALDAFVDELGAWFYALHSIGVPVPPSESELEVTVDEWIRSDAEVGAGESAVCFQADLPPLAEGEVEEGLHRLGDLRGMLLRHLRRRKDAELDVPLGPEWTVRDALEELARTQWWLLTRLGSSPLGELPAKTLGRLDTAMAMVVQQLTLLAPERRGALLEIDGEEWTPRKVLRRLLGLEWAIGRAVETALTGGEP